MKTKQCHHFIVLIGLLIGCLLPATVGASVKVGNFYYNLNASDLTAEVTHAPGTGDGESFISYYLGTVNIPSSINYGGITYNVTSIGQDAFFDSGGMTSLYIPYSVNNIFRPAGRQYGLTWNCCSLFSITVDAGNPTFDSRNNCNAIIETATNELIAGCQNTVIPNGVTGIADCAFALLNTLTSIDIPNSVESIGANAFLCTGLTSLTIPNNVTSIGEEAFESCNLTSIYVQWMNPLTIPGNTFYGVDKSACTLYVPTGSKSAYQNADVWKDFANIEELTLNVDGIYYNISPSTMTASVTKKPSLGYYSGDITIPETVSLDDKTYRVTEIEELAFYDCKSLTSVTIPNGVTSIGYQAFYNCTRLTSIDIPNSVTSIGRGAFSNCTGLTSVTIPNGVTTIEPETFNMCNSLASVIIPNGVTSIGNMAFCRCFDLTSVTIPNGVTSIGYEAFLYCTGLTSVTIPNSVTSISNEAFSNCTSLTSFTCENETPVTITNSVFSGVNKSTCTLNVPTGSKSAYQNADVWKDFTNIVEYEGASPVVLATGQCGDNLTYTIYDDLSMVITGTGPMWDYVAEDTHPNQDYYSDVKSVTIEEGCTYVGKYAFDLMGSLTDVTIPGSVIEIGTGAFSYCRQLSSLELSAGLKIIGGGAFECCGRQNSGLKSITIPSTVTSIGGAAFTSCYLNSITMESSTPLTIQANTFASTDVNSCTLYVPTGSKSAYRSAAVWSEFTNIVEFTPVVVTGQCGDNVSWSFDTNTGELTISGTGPMWDYDWTRPLMDDEYNGSITSVTVEEGVTSIGDYAFYENPNLTSITIPNSVTRIGSGTFCECTGLTSFTIPNSVTNIDSDAFLGTTWYNNQPDGLAYINNVAYRYKGTMPEGTSIAIRNGTVSISECAFSSCTGLTSVTIPNSVTSIGGFAFSDCTNLTSITCESQTPVSISSNNVFHNVDKSACTLYVPAGSKTAYQSAAVWSEFTNIVEQDASVLATGPCGDNLTYTIYDDLSMVITGTGPMWDYSSDTPMNSDYKGSVTSVTIEEGCTAIGKYSFYGCAGLTSVDIPNSVTSIGWNAFANTGLTTVTIPSSVSYISPATFTYCSGLIFINVEAGNATYDSRENCNAIIEKSTNTLIAGCNNTVIPNSVTSIDIYALAGCTGLTSIDIPNSVTSIGEGAFESCTGLTSVDIPNSVTSIGNSAFLVCTGLSSVDIPSSVTSIGDLAFADCTSLSSISVGMTTPIAIPDNVFYDVNKSTCTLYVPAGSLTAYQNAEVWRDFEHIEERVSSVLATGQCGDNLTYTIYDDLSMVITGTGPMWDYDEETMMNSDYMGSIKSVTIEEGCTAIGAYAFNCCYEVTSVTFPNSLTAISECAFKYCVKLISLNIPNGVIAIGDYAFDNCCNLSSITVDDGNTAYDSRDNCNAIINTELDKLILGCKNTVIPVGVTSIGERAFIGCQGLTSIDIPDGVTEIGWWAFMSCHDLTTVSIPHSVTQIGAFAFLDCNSLTSVAIPNSVTYLGGNAFTSCTGLTSVTVEWNTPLEIESNAFENVDKSACTLYVPAGSLTSYQEAEFWGEFQNIVEIGEEPDTDISALDNAIYIERTEGLIGSTMDISVKMKNDFGVRNILFDLELPEGATINGWTLSEDRISEGIPMDKVFSMYSDNGNKIAVECDLNDGDKTFTGNDGEIGTIQVTFADDMEVGNYPVYVFNAHIGDTNNSIDLLLSNTKSTLVLEDYLVGDINGDGKILIGDVIAMLNYIVGSPSNNFNTKAADVNSDGKILIGDVIAVLNIIVNQ